MLVVNVCQDASAAGVELIVKHPLLSEHAETVRTTNLKSKASKTDETAQQRF